MAFAAKAKDLQALRDAVVDAASVGGALWLSYLIVFFYLGIALGGVTHRDLFLETPVKLPFLNVDLPLIGFFVLGPALFLIVHAYTLMHFTLLASKVGAFHTELQEQIADDDTRARLRRQLPSNIFVQFLAGPREVRAGAMGVMLRLIAQISLVAAPVTLLIFFQLQFLPYHDAAISWWQRLIVIADLVLLWALWPSVAQSSATSLRWRDFRRGKVAACLLVSLLAVLLVFTVATFPGEWLEEKLPRLRFLPIPWAKTGWASPHDLLVAGPVNFVTLRPSSLWSNRLVVPGIDVIDHSKFDSEAKIAALTTTVSLRGRDLEGAVLIGAQLQKADFTAARLTHAVLTYADLRGARFACANTGSEEICTQLQNATFRDAKLQGANFEGAQLQNSDFVRAKLQGSSFQNARLQNADLSAAELQGTQFFLARLQDASLISSQLQGALLENAQLQNADLTAAGLQAVSLKGAQLQNAKLREAELEAAFLEDAGLQGASLDGAQLQGASLKGANLEGASLDHVFVWRVRGFNTQGARVGALEPAPKYQGWGCPPPHERCEPRDWTADTFSALKQRIETEVPPGYRRDNALARIRVLDPEQEPAVQPEPKIVR